MARKVVELSAESAAHTDAILSEVHKFLGKKTDERFRVGFRRGAYYLETHTHDFFKQNKDPHQRKEAIDFLLAKVYAKEEGLFRKLDVSNEYVVGYLQALYALPSLFGKNPAFDPSALFTGLYAVFKELNVPVWAGETRVRLSEKQMKANEAIISKVGEVISGQLTGVMAGHLRSAYYFEIHARFFFEKAAGSKRDAAFIDLAEAIEAERKLFSASNKRNEIWRSYISGLDLLLHLLEDNPDFEPNSLFSGLSALISKSLQAERKVRPD